MSHEEKNSVGARIASLRGAMGVGEFADALGINRKTVTRWEANDSFPDGQSLIKLKEVFGADPTWVLLGAGGSPSLDSAARRLIADYEAAGQEGRKLIEGTARLAAQTGEAAAANRSTARKRA